MKKVLIEYKREKSHWSPDIVTEDIMILRKTKSNIKGVVVAIGYGQIGWSLCDKRDIFNKERGIKIAIERAVLHKDCDIEEILKIAPKSLKENIIRINRRSHSYFKRND